MKRKLVLLIFLALLTGCTGSVDISSDTPEQEISESIAPSPAEDFECNFQIGNVAEIKRYIGSDDIVIIPEQIGEYTITGVDRNAFVKTSVKEITYPSTIVDFKGPSGAEELTTINLPPEVTSFSIVTLNGCDKLSCINISGNFNSVDGVVYSADGKTLVCCPPAKSGCFTVPEGVVEIAPYAFSNADINEVILPSTLTKISEYAFYRCSSLPGVTLNEGLQVIGSNAFTGTKITDIFLPKSVQECGSTIIDWGGKRTVSASELTEGLELLLMYEVEFRDESTLTKAVRIADDRTDWLNVKTNKVFVDVDGDHFPEMLEFPYSNLSSVLYRFDTEHSAWTEIAYIYEQLPSFWYGEDAEKYFYYSEPYYYDVVDGAPVSKETIAEKVAPAINVIPDSDKQFEVVMSPFSEEQGGEPSDTWRKQRITEYPYITAQYPESWSVKANGIDILHGGEVEGVSFYNGTLTLDNAQLSSLELDGMENEITYIELIGDCAITTEGEYLEYSGGELNISGDGTLTAYGIRGVETEYSFSHLRIRDGAQVHLTKSAAEGKSFRDGAVQNITSVTMFENGALYCEVLNTDGIALSDSSRLECMHCEAYDSLTLYDNATALIEGDRDYAEWYTLSARLGVNMSGNSRLEVKNGIIAALTCGWGNIRLKDNAVMDISVSDGWADRGILLDGGTLEIKINDSAQLNVNGFITCIEAPRIEINGGSLSCRSASNGKAIDLQYSQSPYADFEPGFYANGKVTEISTDIDVFDEDFTLMTEDEKTTLEEAHSIFIAVEPLNDWGEE